MINHKKLGASSIGLIVMAAVVAAQFSMCPGAIGKKNLDSPLSADAQAQLERAVKYVKGGHPERANEIFNSLIASATDVPKCLAIASATEGYGFPLQDIKRACLQKAMSLSTNRDDVLQVALKARQLQTFEVTKDAVANLVASSKTPQELYDLARKCQEVALTDIAHLAMERAFPMLNNVPDCIDFAKEARQLGQEDLVRKSLKALVDDETSTHNLCILLQNMEGFDNKEMDRYCLRKALDDAKTMDEYFEVLQSAKRHGEMDIVNVSTYRGKKSWLLQKIKSDQEAYQKQVESFKSGAAVAPTSSSADAIPAGTGANGAASGF